MHFGDLTMTGLTLYFTSIYVLRVVEVYVVGQVVDLGPSRWPLSLPEYCLVRDRNQQLHRSSGSRQYRLLLYRLLYGSEHQCISLMVR